MKCVIVSSKSWHANMAASLRRMTGADFIAIREPKDFTAGDLARIRPRYVFLPHWSHRIEAGIFERYECVIFHMTDVPFGRGGSPLQNLIVRGFRDTKISAIRCVAGLDAGPVYLKRPLSLLGSAEEIFLRAAVIIQDMIAEIVRKRLKPRPQRGTPTVFKRRRPEQGDLAAAKSLGEAFDLIRMLDAEDYPSAFLTAGPFKIEFSRASRKSGRVLADARITLMDQNESEEGNVQDR
jgi:methionyl-tRNA formyltransferase